MQFFGMGGTDSLLIILFAVLAVLVIARVRKRQADAALEAARRAEAGSGAGGASSVLAFEGEALVAVIAAAVAAASGMEPGSFRIAGIEPSAGDQGFNTPVWGRADRLARSLTH
ncbi:MAG TPA: hypothetical protein VMV90_05130 [Rectinemataceae bacterium]|nr:hypothetical protein [Rectinemataceae bacterium]